MIIKYQNHLKYEIKSIRGRVSLLPIFATTSTQAPHTLIIPLRLSSGKHYSSLSLDKASNVRTKEPIFEAITG